MISRLCYLMHVCFTVSIFLFISGTPVAAQEWTTINKDYSSQRYVDLPDYATKCRRSEGILRISA